MVDLKFSVPFYKQESKNDCGPTALRMALSFLGEEHSREELISLVEPESSGATWTVALAKAAAQLGFKAEFYSTSLGFNPANYALEFCQKETDGAQSANQKLDKLHRECIKYKVKMQERSLNLKEILLKINKNCVSIILLDWGKIKGADKYQGHFVPIVGYDDDENVYVHNQGLSNPMLNVAIKKTLFESARKAVGTDEDIVFIYRKGAVQ